MRILQVCNKPPYPPRDGGSLAMFNLANALQNLGHHISVLTMFTGKHRLTVEQHKAFARIMEVHTVYVETSVSWKGALKNLIFSDKPYTATRFNSFLFEDELVRLLKTEPFDIIQLEGLYLASYIRSIRQHSQALIALRAHNVEHEIWERIARQEKNFIRKKYFHILAKRLRRYEYAVINTYDLLVPITERDHQKFAEMGNSKPAHVSPAGVNIIKEPEETTNDEDRSVRHFSLFYLGSLDWIPNQEGLLWFIFQVFPTLRHKYPDLKLHIAGRHAPKAFVNKIPLPGIVYHGEVDDAREFTRAHTVLVAPCFSGSGMRLKIIEAMALGKPVVTTSIGAEGLSVMNNENIMIADEAATFGQCLEKLINDAGFSEKIGKAAGQLVFERYNNHEIAASLSAFYNQHLK